MIKSVIDLAPGAILITAILAGTAALAVGLKLERNK